MKLFYSDDYTAALHALETTRKSAWIAQSLAERPIPNVELVSPEPVTADDLALVHDQQYLTTIQTGEPRRMAETNSFAWDPGVWRMGCATTGGAVAAAFAAWQDGVAGSLSSGLHHARRRRGGPYCTFNGLALAACKLVAAGIPRVLILDLDAHCGGGTASIIRDDERIWQLDISVNAFDRYTAAPPRIDLEIIDTDYLDTIRRKLESLTERFDLCLYNAGMDPCPQISAGELALREELVFGWAHERELPTAFVLAGGYTVPGVSQEMLIDLHRLTITSAAATHAAWQR